MKYIKYLITVFSFSFLSFYPIENSSNAFTTNCNQTFHFFFFNEGTPTFWIGEDLSGECRISRLINIGISDTLVSVSKSELNEFADWKSIRGLSSVFSMYEEQALNLKDNIWHLNDLNIYSPPFDSLLAEEFNGHIAHGGSDALSWIKIKGQDGIILPKIEGIKTEFLFSYETGLYINYEISEVHYFPNSYILIFTNQPSKAVGLDTMHGFLIFRIKGNA